MGDDIIEFDNLDFDDDPVVDFGLDDAFGEGPMDVHEGRSERAQAIDEAKEAEIAPSFEEYRENPDDFDWPGVDEENPAFDLIGEAEDDLFG